MDNPTASTEDVDETKNIADEEIGYYLPFALLLLSKVSLFQT